MMSLSFATYSRCFEISSLYWLGTSLVKKIPECWNIILSKQNKGERIDYWSDYLWDAIEVMINVLKNPCRHIKQYWIRSMLFYYDHNIFKELVKYLWILQTKCPNSKSVFLVPVVLSTLYHIYPDANLMKNIGIWIDANYSE